MPIFGAILSFLESLFTSSIFSNFLHSLLSDMGKAADEAKWDTAVQDAAALLQQGTPLTAAVGKLVTDTGLAEHHAMAVVAAAKAHLPNLGLV